MWIVRCVTEKDATIWRKYNEIYLRIQRTIKVFEVNKYICLSISEQDTELYGILNWVSVGNSGVNI